MRAALSKTPDSGLRTPDFSWKALDEEVSDTFPRGAHLRAGHRRTRAVASAVSTETFGRAGRRSAARSAAAGRAARARFARPQRLRHTGFARPAPDRDDGRARRRRMGSDT